MKRAGVFGCLGLGDGLISLVLSNNLKLNGYETVTFHPFLFSMQEWFPGLSIQPFPHEIKATLDSLDQIFILLEKTEKMAEVISCALQFYRDKTTILNPIATKNRDYPFWKEGEFDGTRSLVDNLYTFCGKKRGFLVVTKSNGIVPPPHLTPKKHTKRVILHPTSSRIGKNWSWEKFLSLGDRLEKLGFCPIFLLTKEEKKTYLVSEEKAPLFANLNEVASYIYESGYFIGNDSGPGHLASCLNIPTLSLFRNQETAHFWRPSWSRSEILCPSKWIPNIKWLRWRDRHWQKWVSVEMVLQRFLKLCESSHERALHPHLGKEDVIGKPE